MYKNAIFMGGAGRYYHMVGKIVDRMSELKGLSSQDPMKSDQDRASYNNEFKDLQAQLYDIHLKDEVQRGKFVC